MVHESRVMSLSLPFPDVRDICLGPGLRGLGRIAVWVCGPECARLAFGSFYTGAPKRHPANTGPLKGNTRPLMARTCHRRGALRGPAGAPSPCRSAIWLRRLREREFTVWLVPACLHMGHKAQHCAVLATSLPSQSS